MITRPARLFPPATPMFRLPALVCLLLTAAGCSLGPQPKGIRPDPAAVRNIGFRIAPDHLGAAGEPARLAAMAGRVAKNLASWGYPIEADQEGEGTGYSHVLEGKVGEVTHKSTPTGFSFTMGNSDPRALDFQKADALPVDCELRAAGRPGERASLYMDFVAGDRLKTASRSDPAVIDTYVEHIATVCFNLLDDLKVPRRKAVPDEASTTSVTPAWMPEVRIEIRDKPADPLALPAQAPAAPPAVSTPVPAAEPRAVPAPAAAPSLPKGEPAPPPVSEPRPVPETPSVTTEIRKEEGRKQMIIHNQGSPIILEFGYERK